MIVNESFGQIKYEKGYFINLTNERTECLIKNKDWKNNPTEFSYKLEKSSLSEEGNINTIKEFGIYNFSKFVSTDVKIDRSISLATELIGNENPLWRQETLFLKVLLDGKAKLYSYDSNNGRKFFYSVADSSINQLIYKRFRINFLAKNTFGEQLSPIAENNTYKDQLLMDLNCPNATLESVENITYRTEDLEKYFQSYNSCMGDTIIEKNKITKKSYFNLKITPGINSSSLAMSLTDIPDHSPDLNFKRNLSFRLGLELESILPFNKNKWALVFEPTFQSFDSETEDGYFKAKFKFIEFPLGIRYYLYLNDYNKLYLNCFYIPYVQVNFKSNIELNPAYKFDISTRANWAFGGGFEHKRLSLETRYYTDRDIMHYGNYYADYSRFSLILGYKIINGKH